MADDKRGIALICEYVASVGLRLSVRVKKDEGFEYDEDPENDGVPKGAYEIDGCIFVAPGKKSRHALGQHVWLDWWYVYTYRTVNNYPRAPDDVDTVPLADSQSFAEAAKLGIVHALQHRWAQVDEAAYIAEIREQL